MPSSPISPPFAPAEPRLSSRRLWLWASAEALLAFALAMLHISARSVWYDEGVVERFDRR